MKTANQLIKEYLHTNGISKTALGKKLTPALKQQAIWKVLEKNDLDTGFVMQVSKALAGMVGQRHTLILPFTLQCGLALSFSF